MDVSDPRSPRQVGAFATEGKAKALYMNGKRLYVVGSRDQEANDAVTFLNVADPLHPEQVGTYSPPDDLPARARIWDVTVQDELMYLLIGSSVSGYSRFLVVDVREPASPALVARYEPPPSDWWGRLADMKGMTVAGNYVYVGARSHSGGPPTPTVGPGTPTPPKSIQGVLALDISDLRAMKEVTRVETFVPDKMVVVGDRLFALDNMNVAMFDVSEPAAPRKMDTWSGTNNMVSLQVDGGFVYVTRGWDSDYGFQDTGLVVLGDR